MIGNNYLLLLCFLLQQDGSSDHNSELHPPQPFEVSSTDQEMSPRNSAVETSASVSLSVPVVIDGQEQVLMAAIPKVLTMPSACSDASSNVFMVSICASSHGSLCYHRYHWLNCSMLHVCRAFCVRACVWVYGFQYHVGEHLHMVS